MRITVLARSTPQARGAPLRYALRVTGRCAP